MWTQRALLELVSLPGLEVNACCFRGVDSLTMKWEWLFWSLDGSNQPGNIAIITKFPGLPSKKQPVIGWDGPKISSCVTTLMEHPEAEGRSSLEGNDLQADPKIMNMCCQLGNHDAEGLKQNNFYRIKSSKYHCGPHWELSVKSECHALLERLGFCPTVSLPEQANWP